MSISYLREHPIDNVDPKPFNINIVARIKLVCQRSQPFHNAFHFGHISHNIIYELPSYNEPDA